jgi:hypothetical protein
MTAPAAGAEAWIAAATGVRSESFVLGTLFALMIIALPVALIGMASAATRLLLPQGGRSVGAIVRRYVHALAPLGLGIWAAHYGFHALTGALTIVPVTQSALADLTGRAMLGEPLWMLTGAAPGSVYPIQLGCLLLGAIGSIAVAHRVSTRLHPGRPIAASLPWIALIAALALTATWVLSQPMDMRAVGVPG